MNSASVCGEAPTLTCKRGDIASKAMLLQYFILRKGTTGQRREGNRGVQPAKVEEDVAEAVVKFVAEAVVTVVAVALAMVEALV